MHNDSTNLIWFIIPAIIIIWVYVWWQFKNLKINSNKISQKYQRLCPECKDQELIIEFFKNLDDIDPNWYENLLQILKCGKCNKKYIGYYQEEKQGGFDNETWQSIGYKVPQEEIKEIEIKLKNNEKIDPRKYLKNENIFYTFFSE